MSPRRAGRREDFVLSRGHSSCYVRSLRPRLAPPIAPRRRAIITEGTLTYRWAVLAAGTTAQAAFSTVTFAIAVMAPALRDKYGLSLTEIGIVLAAEWVGLTLAMLPWGFAVDRFGERWTLAGGLGACAAFLAASASAPSFGWLVTFLGLAGIAGGSVQSGSGRAVMRWFAASERGLALGIRQCAVPIGGAIAAIVLPQLGSPKAGFLFISAFVLAGAIAGALVLRSGTEEHIEVTDVEITLRDRRLWLACWASSLYVVAQVAMMGFVVLFLHDVHGYSTGEAAAVFAVAQGLAAALRIGVGRWSDVVGSRVGPLRRIGVAIAVTLLAVAVLSDAPGLLLVPALAIATALSMAWNGLAFTIAAELGGRRSGAAIGFQQTILSGLGVAAPVAFAAVVSASSWSLAFGLVAFFPLVGAWLLRPLAVS